MSVQPNTWPLEAQHFAAVSLCLRWTLATITDYALNI